MKQLFPCAATMTFLLSSTIHASADVNVVASIKPLHSLVAAVMGDVAEPTLLVKGATSPHTFQLRPSDARAIQDADIVFWIDESLEPAIGRAIESIADDDKAISLMGADGLTLYSFREGGAFEGHDHDHHGGEDHDEDDHDDHDHDKHAEAEGDDHDHDEHDHEDEKHEHEDHAHEDHGHDDHDDHDHEKHAEEEHDHDHDHEKHAEAEDDDHGHEEHAHDDHKEDAHDHGHEGHDHAELDPHIWLDPRNAVAMVEAIEEALSEIAPEHHDTFHQNADKVIAELAELEHEIEHILEDLSDPTYIVFHDAYQSFEARFDIPASGSLTINPEIAPGAARLREIQEHVEETGATCIFSEPQFSPDVVQNIADSVGVNVGVLDPQGAELEPGPQLYGQLLTNMATSLKGCLSKG